MSPRSAPAWTGIVIGLLVGALLGSGLLLWRVNNENADLRSDLAQRPVAGTDSANGTAPTGADTTAASFRDPVGMGRDNAIVRATRRVAAAVVSVHVVQQQTVRRTSMEIWERLFFGRGPQGTRRSVNFGSGVIVSDDGLVLTNAHVVGGAEQIVVTLTDGRRFAARLLESVDRFDLALLDIDGEQLPVAPMGTADDLLIGEWSIAIGSPFGYLLADTQPTVTVGVISALNRDIKRSDQARDYLGMIQTDAAINPGNSGGPLVNTAGEVIGINTFIFSESGGSIGIGFAVPIERGRWLIDEVLTYGHFRDFYAGIAMYELWPELIERWQLSDPVGFVVTGIDPDAPAWRAGLRVGDIIRQFEGRPLTGRDVLTRVQYDAAVGDCLRFVAEREGEEFTGEIILEEMR